MLSKKQCRQRKQHHLLSRILRYMGCKAIEVLLSLGQTSVYVISRSPHNAAIRNPELASSVKIMTFEEWKKSSIKPNLIISTIRITKPHSMNPIHFQVQVMQWSWIFLGPVDLDKVEFQKIKNCLGWNIGLEWLTGWESNGIIPQQSNKASY